jgi:hypothetical protein
MTSDNESKLSTQLLVKAIAQHDLIQIERLITAGVDVNLPQSRRGKYSSDTPLGVAIAYRDLEIVKTLLAAGAYPHAFFLGEALDIALREKSTEFLLALIAANVDVNFRFEEGNTALILAAIAGAITIVKLLVEAGSDVNLTNRGGEFALLYAAYGDWQEVYDYLAPLTASELQAKAEKSLLTRLIYRRRKNNPLTENFIAAATKGDVETVLATIENGVDINAFDASGSGDFRAVGVVHIGNARITRTWRIHFK